MRNGSTRTDACCIAGIVYDTFLEWMKKPEFAESIKKAEAECKQRNITIIQKAAITTWQAAAWWLERKHWKEFALKGRDDTGEDEVPQRMAERAKKILDELEKNGKPKIHS